MQLICVGSVCYLLCLYIWNLHEHRKKRVYEKIYCLRIYINMKKKEYKWIRISLTVFLPVRLHLWSVWIVSLTAKLVILRDQSFIPNSHLNMFLREYINYCSPLLLNWWKSYKDTIRYMKHSTQVPISRHHLPNLMPRKLLEGTVFPLTI